MFTGIVEEIGVIKGIVHRKNLSQLTLEAKKVLKGSKLGDSLAVNGVCLTLARKQGRKAVFDVMQETLLKTNIGALKNEDSVNLERPMKAKARVHGHFVTGHIDETAVIKKQIERKNYVEICIGMKRNLKPFLVSKGSVCIDGVSLTVGKVTPAYFSVYLIPFTLKKTVLGQRRVGDKVNIEADVLAKYILNKKRK